MFINTTKLSGVVPPIESAVKKRTLRSRGFLDHGMPAGGPELCQLTFQVIVAVSRIRNASA